MNMGEFMRYLLTLATLLVGLVLASTTYAALLSKDSTFGPNTITRDTDTGLDWLDLTLSTNRSYDDVITQFGIGGDYSGFRHATVAEVIELWNHAGIANSFATPVAGPVVGGLVFGPDDALSGPITTLQGLFGIP